MGIRMRITVAAVAAAAAVAAGTTAAVASSNSGTHRPAGAPAAATTFTWTSLSLLNGWTALSGSTYGTPSFSVQNGVLYLRGILSSPSSGAPEFAVLPAGARPSHYLWLSYVNFGGDDIGTMEIEPNGEMFVYASTSGGPVVDPSLDAISFPLSS